MRPSSLAIAALFAALLAAPAGAAVTRGSADQGSDVARQAGGGDGLFNRQCYPTGAAFVMRCNTPPVAASDDCSCTQVKVRTRDGSIAYKADCGRDRLLAVKASAGPCASNHRMRRTGG